MLDHIYYIQLARGRCQMTLGSAKNKRWLVECAPCPVAYKVMHRRWCTEGDAQKVIHRRWCTEGDATQVATKNAVFANILTSAKLTNVCASKDQYRVTNWSKGWPTGPGDIQQVMATTVGGEATTVKVVRRWPSKSRGGDRLGPDAPTITVEREG